MDIVDKFYRFIAPELAQLREAVNNIKKDISELKTDTRELWKSCNDLSERLSRIEGKYESVEETVLAKVQNQLLQMIVRRIEGASDKK